MGTELTKAGGGDLVAMINAAMPELKRMAPKYVNLSRLTSLAIEAKMRNGLLASCSPVSVLNFCKKCAEMGTDRVGAGGMWAVPFKAGNGYDMVPMPDWRLLIERCKKSKCITHATAECVFEADVFEMERGLEPKLRHVPALKERGKIIGAYCVYVLPDGSRDFGFMPVDELDHIRGKSRAQKDGPWVTDTAEMYKKTVVRRALKVFEGASPELTQLIELDNAACGYADAEPLRQPVGMPKEKTPPAGPTIDATATEKPASAPATSAASAPAAGAPAKDAAAADASAPAGDESGSERLPIPSVEGLVEVVSKNETKKPGCFKYGVKIDGKFYNTFDVKVAEKATQAKNDGVPVRIQYANNEKYRSMDILTVTLLIGSEPETGKDNEQAL